MAVRFTEDRLLSSDGKTQLYLAKWQDDGAAPRGVIQLSHGMCEYVRRYDEFARFLAARGFVVCGNDHLGHGDSAASADDLGFIAEKDGYLRMVEDLRAVTLRLRGEYPGLPLLLYGHSMGSFLARYYAAAYPDGVDAYVFSGTGGPNPAAGAGLALIGILSAFKGERYRSPFITNMSFGSYNKTFPEAPTGYEWVTSDPEKLHAYVNDPFCMFTFTLSAYRDLMRALQAVSRQDWATKLRSALPYLLVSGQNDPVGDYGKGVATVYERMRAAGCAKAELRLLPDCRHEPHNEVGRADFYADTLAWMERALGC